MTLSEEIRKGESDELEFKRDVPSEKVKLLKTVCAFANCNGGRIIVGVDDNRAIVGVDGMSAFKLADRLVDTISNGCSPQVPVTVALYDDRLEVTSPGGLPHGMTMDMMLSGHSRSRNKSLALAFRYMNLIEEWGSGIPRIQEQLERAGLRPLTIESSGMDLRFVIWRKPAAVETINETISETIKERETTNETISVAADIVAANPGIGRAALIGKVGKSRATVARALATLVAKGLVVYRGSRKCGGYYPCCVRG